tara:strand:- start:521 stop:1123 length:603 start_codon:yes stop_codon:yes gene_type:complete
MDDPDIIEYKEYFTEKESKPINIQDQIKTNPHITRASPLHGEEHCQLELEPFCFDYEETSNIDEQGEDLLWFGDPCYIVQDKRWDSFCYLKSEHQYKVIDKSFPCPFYVWSTAWGDGEYDLKLNGKVVAPLGVDAGMLSIIPMRLVKKWRNESGKKLGDVPPGPFSGGWALQGSFLGNMSVRRGNMSFVGTHNISILTNY